MTSSTLRSAVRVERENEVTLLDKTYRERKLMGAIQPVLVNLRVSVLAYIRLGAVGLAKG